MTRVEVEEYFYGVTEYGATIQELSISFGLVRDVQSFDDNTLSEILGNDIKIEWQTKLDERNGIIDFDAFKGDLDRLLESNLEYSLSRLWTERHTAKVTVKVFLRRERS